MQVQGNHEFEDVIEFLSSVSNARIEALSLSERALSLEEAVTRITPAYSLATGGGGEKDYDKKLILFSDVWDEYQRRMREYFEQMGVVEDFIDRIPGAKNRQLLKLRFLNCMSWSRVAEAFRTANEDYSISDRHIYRIRTRALRAAKELWEAEHDNSNRKKP